MIKFMMKTGVPRIFKSKYEQTILFKSMVKESRFKIRDFRSILFLQYTAPKNLSLFDKHTKGITNIFKWLSRAKFWFFMLSVGCTTVPYTKCLESFLDITQSRKLTAKDVCEDYLSKIKLYSFKVSQNGKKVYCTNSEILWYSVCCQYWSFR